MNSHRMSQPMIGELSKLWIKSISRPRGAEAKSPCNQNQSIKKTSLHCCVIQWIHQMVFSADPLRLRRFHKKKVEQAGLWQALFIFCSLWSLTLHPTWWWCRIMLCCVGSQRKSNLWKNAPKETRECLDNTFPRCSFYIFAVCLFILYIIHIWYIILYDGNCSSLVVVLANRNAVGCVSWLGRSCPLEINANCTSPRCSLYFVQFVRSNSGIGTKYTIISWISE